MPAGESGMGSFPSRRRKKPKPVPMTSLISGEGLKQSSVLFRLKAVSVLDRTWNEENKNKYSSYLARVA